MPAFPKPNPTETDPVASPTAAAAGIAAAAAQITADSAASAASAAQSTADSAVTAAGLNLAKASNLGDLASAATARTNLGLGTAATTAASAYATAAQGAKADSAFPADTASVVMWVPPAAQTNWSSYGQNAAAIGDFTLTSSGAQNALVAFDVWLSAGTWSVLLMYITNTDQGIITVSIDGTDVGTVDAYGASLTYNNITAITGVAVASSGRKRVQLKMATKNASASNYYCRFQQLAFVRTA